MRFDKQSSCCYTQLMQSSHMTKARGGPHRVGFDVECGKDVQVVGGGPQGCE